MFLKMEHENGFYLHECDAVSVAHEKERSVKSKEADRRLLHDRIGSGGSDEEFVEAPGQHWPSMLAVLWNGEATVTIETEFPIYLMNGQGKTVDKWVP